MVSLLRAALEGELAAPAEDERELMELKGPLSEVFSQALNQVYARPEASPPDASSPAQPDAADASAASGTSGTSGATGKGEQSGRQSGGVTTDEPQGKSQALESQANDALALAELINSVELAGGDAEAGSAATTVYGVSATDVKPEHIVEVSQDLAGRQREADDYVLVMDATQPSVNGSDSSNPEPRVVELANALESLVHAYGRRVYPSLEAFARDWVASRHTSQHRGRHHPQT